MSINWLSACLLLVGYKQVYWNLQKKQSVLSHEVWELLPICRYNSVYIGNTYILFSEHFVCYLEEKENSWEGFSYTVDKYAYVGQFHNLQSNGYGKGIFL